MMLNTVITVTAEISSCGKLWPDHLAQRVDIVGIIAHDIAMIVGIEIADGKVLHAVEHLLAHFFQRALR